MIIDFVSLSKTDGRVGLGCVHRSQSGVSDCVYAFRSCDDFVFMLHSHWDILHGLFWLLLGNYDEEKITVKDPHFWATSICGHIFMIVYVICMVIVALNMLIAMMNNSFQRCMVSILTPPLFCCNNFLRLNSR